MELSRDIANKFNLDFNSPKFFIAPEPLIQKNFARIMSLKDGTKKMSKSDPSDLSRINLNDTSDQISNKIKKAKTDSEPLPDNEIDLSKRPEAENLLGIYSSLSDQLLSKTIDEFSGKNFSDFKDKLLNLVVDKIAPISLEINKLLKDQKFLDEVLKEGANKAEEIAQRKIKNIKKSLDFSDKLNLKILFSIYIQVMFVQTLKTPNPNSLKFLPGEKVSLSGPVEFTEKKQISNDLVRNILSINGVSGIFLSEDFLSVSKDPKIDWEEIKHIIISFINEYYSDGKKFVYDAKKTENLDENYDEIEKKIIQILETKIRPAVARDGGDIKFKEFKNGKVKVEMQGSCSGCPSSTMTLKKGVENLLKHYIPEVNEVIPINN